MQNTNWEKFTLDVINGSSGGKILFQPRILCWYSDKVFSGESLGEFEGCKLSDIYKKLDVCNRIYDYGACIQRTISDKRITHSFKQVSEWEKEFGIHTPIGDISMTLVKNNSNGGEFFSKWWVENEDDLRVYTYYENASDYVFYPDIFHEIKSEWGNMGAPTLYMPRVNIMHAYLDTMGVENATYALADYPELIKDYFQALKNSQTRYMQVLKSVDIKIINFGDNVHCKLLGDELMEEFLLPEYVRRNEFLHSCGKFTHAHWDGDTKSILKYLRHTHLDGIEAVTPLPQGDVTLEEIRDNLPQDMFLIDGIAALLFAKPYTDEQLAEQTEKLIKLFAPKLIVGISDEMASFGDINRVRLVKKIIDKYNETLKI